MIRFSLISSAIRKELYKICYDSINTNNHIEFEMIFAGDNQPDIRMPDNFIYIKSDDSPAFCLEMAARRAKGEYLITTGDDMLYSCNFLDNFDKNIREYDGQKIMIGARFKTNEIIMDIKDMVFDSNIKGSPLVGVSVAYDRKMWYELGGIDRRFFGSFADIDMQMRFFEAGYKLKIVDDIWTNEIESQIKGKKRRLIKRVGRESRILLNSLWVVDNKMSNKRLDIVKSF